MDEISLESRCKSREAEYGERLQRSSAVTSCSCPLSRSRPSSGPLRERYVFALVAGALKGEKSVASPWLLRVPRGAHLLDLDFAKAALP